MRAPEENDLERHQTEVNDRPQFQEICMRSPQSGADQQNAICNSFDDLTRQENKMVCFARKDCLLIEVHVDCSEHGSELDSNSNDAYQGELLINLHVYLPPDHTGPYQLNDSEEEGNVHHYPEWHAVAEPLWWCLCLCHVLLI